MALHGDIMVNGTQIGVWSARRTTPLAEDREVYYYDCEVRWYTPDGKMHERTLTIDHAYSTGSILLAARVLQVAGFMKEEFGVRT